MWFGYPSKYCHLQKINFKWNVKEISLLCGGLVYGPTRQPELDLYGQFRYEEEMAPWGLLSICNETVQVLEKSILNNNFGVITSSVSLFNSAS